MADLAQPLFSVTARAFDRPDELPDVGPADEAGSPPRRSVAVGDPGEAPCLEAWKTVVDRGAWQTTRMAAGLRFLGESKRDVARYHPASMSNVLVRDLPEQVHGELQRRAERRGQSLQQYLVHELTRLAEKPSLDELLDRIDRRRGGRVGFEQAARDLADERVRQ